MDISKFYVCNYVTVGMCLIRRVYGTEFIKCLAHGCTYNVWTFLSSLKWAGTKYRIRLYCNSLF